MKSRTSRRSGFTLVETVVALALTTVVLAALGSLLISFQQMTAAAFRLSGAQTDAGTLMEAVLTRVRDASSVRITAARDGRTDEEGVRYAYAENGGVYTEDSAPVLAAGTYTYGVSFQRLGTKSVKVTVAVYQNGEPVYRQSSDLVFTNLTSGDVSGEESGACLAYQVPDNPFVGIQSIAVQSSGSFITEKNATMSITAIITPGNASFPSVYWTVDNTAVAAIGPDGVLKALSNGVVTVTATAMDGTDVQSSKTITVSGQ